MPTPHGRTRTRSRRPRDNQRSRLYRAQEGIDGMGRTFGSLQECQQYVDAVLTSEFVESRWGPRRIRVERGRGPNGTAYWTHHRITVGVPAQCEWVLLHELAHMLGPSNARHDPRFAATYLTLVREFLGDEAAETLRAGFHRPPGRDLTVMAPVPPPGSHGIHRAARRYLGTERAPTRSGFHGSPRSRRLQRFLLCRSPAEPSDVRA